MSNERKAANDDTEVWEDGGLPIDHGEQDTACSLSGLSRTTIYKAMDAGLLVWSKVGSRRVVARRSLVRLLANGAQIKEIAA